MLMPKYPYAFRKSDFIFQNMFKMLFWYNRAIIGCCVQAKCGFTCPPSKNEILCGIQIIKMCHTFAKLGINLTLLAPKRKQINPSLLDQNPYNYYQVEPIFNIKYLFNIDLFLFALKIVRQKLHMQKIFGMSIICQILILRPIDLRIVKAIDIMKDCHQWGKFLPEKSLHQFYQF